MGDFVVPKRLPSLLELARSLAVMVESTSSNPDAPLVASCRRALCGISADAPLPSPARHVVFRDTVTRVYTGFKFSVYTGIRKRDGGGLSRG